MWTKKIARRANVVKTKKTLNAPENVRKTENAAKKDKKMQMEKVLAERMQRKADAAKMLKKANAPKAKKML